MYAKLMALINKPELNAPSIGRLYHALWDDDKTEIHQSIVITDEDAKCFICPNHYFTEETLLSEIQPAGFSIYEFYGDISGKQYPDTGETICCILTK